MIGDESSVDETCAWHNFIKPGICGEFNESILLCLFIPHGFEIKG